MENGDQLIHSFQQTDSSEGNFFGLTKREYFAGLAMQGILANNGLTRTIDGIVSKSLEIADELLKQLEKPKE